MTARRLSLLVPAVLVAALLLPASALGQSSRTWVSGANGDDTFPCSRTAPCRTLQQGFNTVASGGEINILDGCGCGGMTITRSVTVRMRNHTAGALVSGTNGITINAGANDKVVLDGLDIFGTGTGAPTSLSGVKVLSAKSVIIRNSEIMRFKAGINVAPTSPQTRVVVSDNVINDNGVGIINAPGNNTISFTSL